MNSVAFARVAYPMIQRVFPYVARSHASIRNRARTLLILVVDEGFTLIQIGEAS